MRMITRILIMICLVSPLNEALAQEIADMMETTWYGASKARSEITESGYFYCDQVMYDVSYDYYTDTVTGVMKTIFNLDGEEYISIWAVKGEMDTEDFSILIRPDYKIREDELPGGLYWIADNIYLQLYTDAEHDGYYIMSGQTSGMNYSDEVFELGDYPY